MKKAFIMFSILLTGCAGSASYQAQNQWQQAFQREAQAWQTVESKYISCEEKYKANGKVEQNKAVEYETCKSNLVRTAVLPNAVFPDLVLETLATNMGIATDYQQGKITREEANVKLMESEANYVKEGDLRYRQALGQAAQYDMVMQQQRQQYFQNLSQQLNQPAQQPTLQPPKTTQCHSVAGTITCQTW